MGGVAQITGRAALAVVMVQTLRAYLTASRKN
jgi:hypothetical protein